MNNQNGASYYEIRLSNEQLRRDAQQAINSVNSMGDRFVTQGQRIDAAYSKATGAVTSSIRQMTSGVKTAMLDMGKSILGISALLASGSFIKDLYADTKQFSRAMRVVSTISEEVSNDLQGYKDKVLDLCTQISVAPTTAADALYQINSAGHLGADGMEVLKVSAKAAVGGVTETATAADAITTVLNAYGKSAKEAEKVSDMLFTTVRLGKTTMGELGASISTVAPLAATYGVSIEEVLSLVAQLTKQGKNTRTAMTEISAGIQAVTSSLGDGAFKTRTLLEAFEEVNEKSKGSENALKTDLGNVRALRAVLAATGSHAQETAEMLDEIRSSAGAAEEAFVKMNTTAGAQLTILKNNFMKEFQSIGDGMTGHLGNVAKELNAAFENGNMQKAIQLLKDLIITYGIYKATMITIMAVQKGYNALMTEAALQQKLAAMAGVQLTKSQALGATATMSLKRAWQALTVAISTNAIGLAVTAIAAIAYGIYKYTTRVTDAEKATKRLNEATRKMASEVADEKKKVAELLNTLKTAKKDSDEYKKAKQRILDQYGQYLKGLTNEKGEITSLAEAYRVLTNEINQAARARAMDELNKKAAEDYADTNKGKAEQLKKTLRAQGLSDDDAELAVQRILSSITSTGDLPAGINSQYGVTVDVVAAALRKRFESQHGIAPDTRKRNADDAVAKFRAAVAGKSGDASLTDAELQQIFNKANLGNYLPLLNSNELYGRRTAMNQMQGLRQAAQSYQETIRKNELYTGMSVHDSSQWQGLDDNKLAADLNYILNTVIPKMEAGDYAGGVNFKFGDGRVQKFTSLEQLRTVVQHMQTEQSDRKAAAGLASEADEAEGGSKQLTDEELQKLLDMAANAVLMSDISAAKKKLKETLEEGALQPGSEGYKKLQAAYASLRAKDPTDKNGSSGKTSAQLAAEETEARQKGLNLEVTQNRERIRILEADELEHRQRMIDLMKDGADKLAAQRALNAAKEDAEMQHRMEEAIAAEIARQEELFNAKEEAAEKAAAARGQKYAKRTFNPGALLSADFSAGSSIAQNEAAGDVNVEALNDILARYEGYFAAIKQIRQESYDNAEAQAMEEYLRQWGEYAEKRNAIIQQADRALAQAATEGERQSITAQMNKDLSELDVEAKKRTSAISRLFDDMTNKTVKDLRSIAAAGEKALQFLIAGEWDEAKGIEFGMTKETFDILRKSPDELDKIRKAIKEITEEADEAEGAFRRMASGLKDLFAANDTKGVRKALGEIEDGLNDIMRVGSFVSNTLSSLGDALGGGVLSGIADGLNVAMDAANSAMSGAQAGAVFGPWGAAAGAAIGAVSSLVGAFAKLHDAKHEKKIKKLQDQIAVLERDYDRLGKKVENAYSKDASNMIEQQNTLLRQQKVLIQNQIAEEKAKKKTDNERVKQWEQQIADINDLIADNEEKARDAIFGEDIKSAIDNFSEAYANMFSDGTTRAKASKDIVKSMIKQMIVEAMKSDIQKPMQALREKMLQFWADGYIDANEKGILDSMGEQIMADLEKQYGWADGYFQDSSSQNGGSKGGFTTMSQDSADELNGRFTALQLNSEVIKESVLELNEVLLTIRTQIMESRAANEETRNLMLLALDHLETIAENTHELYEMNERLGKIEKYTSRL